MGHHSCNDEHLLWNQKEHKAVVKCFFTDCSAALCPVRAPGCSAAAEERMQRGAGEATGQYGGCAEELNQAALPCEAKFKQFKY